MTTLKISWTAKQDMRRVQVAAVRQTLASLPGRSSLDVNAEHLSFRDLRDYVLWIFPELAAPVCDVRLYYIDDDQEQVRITNDVELDEAFRLMRELAVAAGRDAATAVCKITVVATTREAGAVDKVEETMRCSSSHAEVDAVPQDTEELLASRQKKQMLDLFVDLGKVIEQWSARGEHETLKKDLVSLLHEPGCQEALLEIMANAKFAMLFQTVTEGCLKKGNFTECLLAVAGTGELEEVAKILLAKCPNARVQVERVLQQVQHSHNAQLMSASDYFETISKEETKQDLGPVVAVFEGDVTCPDGTVLEPGEAFDKVWKLRNGGSSKWPVGAVLSCVGGDKMQAPESVLIPSVQPGKSIDVSLRMVAPTKAGRYTGYWRLSTPDGNRFGQRLWVDINVMDPEELTPGKTGAEEVRADDAFASVLSSGGKESTVATPIVAETESNKSLRWSNQLQVLASMGFANNMRNLALLTQHDGDMEIVITDLLS